ncbi:hypothetical protein ACIQNU_40290 [Streptomyces sp. NPDC091292]|uniref:hypothetical protein n=1 Tax=Streptomyces sp. NPDC091292 TaxID=3365991 RepID=UPI00382E86F5
MIETAADFVRLVESEDPVERRRSTCEDAPLSVWEALVTSRPDMRFWVANNRTVPDDILRMLARDNDWRVRHRVASKMSCPIDILELLSVDGHDSVASLIAGHPKTPTTALRRLLKYPWDQVVEKATRQLVARGEELNE